MGRVKSAVVTQNGEALPKAPPNDPQRQGNIWHRYEQLESMTKSLAGVNQQMVMEKAKHQRVRPYIAVSDPISNCRIPSDNLSIWRTATPQNGARQACRWRKTDSISQAWCSTFTSEERISQASSDKLCKGLDCKREASSGTGHKPGSKGYDLI